MNISLWYFLAGFAFIGLIIFYKKGAAWGGLVLGAVAGCVISIIHNDNGQGFQFFYVKRAAIIGALAGVVISFIIRQVNKAKHKQIRTR